MSDAEQEEFKRRFQEEDPYVDSDNEGDRSASPSRASSKSAKKEEEADLYFFDDVAPASIEILGAGSPSAAAEDASSRKRSRSPSPERPSKPPMSFKLDASSAPSSAPVSSGISSVVIQSNPAPGTHPVSILKCSGCRKKRAITRCQSCDDVLYCDDCFKKVHPGRLSIAHIRVKIDGPRCSECNVHDSVCECVSCRNLLFCDDCFKSVHTPRVMRDHQRVDFIEGIPSQGALDAIAVRSGLKPVGASSSYSSSSVIPQAQIAPPMLQQQRPLYPQPMRGAAPPYPSPYGMPPGMMPPMMPPPPIHGGFMPQQQQQQGQYQDKRRRMEGGYMDQQQQQQQIVTGPGFMIEVEFKRGRRAWYFAEPHKREGLVVEDYVMVEADRGEDLGRVVRFVEVDSRKDGAPLLLRKASQAAIDDIEDKLREEAEAVNVCKAMMVRAGLSSKMTVVDAEYQFDRNKLTFLYITPNRDAYVDFREAIRELYQVYHARIWMSRLKQPGE